MTDTTKEEIEQYGLKYVTARLFTRYVSLHFRNHKFLTENQFWEYMKKTTKEVEKVMK